jgi:hypothetical protein
VIYALKQETRRVFYRAKIHKGRLSRVVFASIARHYAANCLGTDGNHPQTEMPSGVSKPLISFLIEQPATNTLYEQP